MKTKKYSANFLQDPKSEELIGEFEACLSPLKMQDENMFSCIMDHVNEFRNAQNKCLIDKFNVEVENQHLKELNDARMQAILEVSHELKAPLSAIMSLLNVILDGYVPDPQKQQDMLKRAFNRSKALHTLVKDILELGKTELDPSAMEMERVDLRVLIHEIYENFLDFAREKNIKLRLVIDEDLFFAKANSAMIMRVFENLVSNAIKYNRDGGHVIITAQNTLDGRIAVKISDNGIGISPEDQKDLFKLFYRVRSKQALSQEGTGLGLSFTRTIVHAHGSDIFVKSEPGRGSHFSFYLNPFK